jgi:hypothetical protein
MLGFLQLFGTYMRLTQPGYKRFFKVTDTTGMVVLSGIRLQALPILFFNVHYSRGYRIVRSAGSEFHMGNDLIVDPSDGRPSKFFDREAIFENVQQVFFEIEFGWEFDED